MSHKILPYLQCLRNTFTALNPALANNPGLALQGTVAANLLDRMIVDYSRAIDYQADYSAALLKLLPEIKQALGGNARDAIAELQNVGGDFERMCLLAGEVQRALVAVASPQANRLAKAMVEMEADYSIKVDKATLEQIAKSAAVVPQSSVIRNTREIDENKLVDFIRKLYPEETDLTIKSSSFIPGGFSKFTANVALDNCKSLPQNLVMRGDAAATFGGASVVDEYRLIKAMYDNGACVPRPLAVDESGKVFGSPIMLAEKKPGGIIGHMFNLPKPNRTTAIDVATQLAAIHRVPLSAVGNRVDSADIPSSQKALAWLEEGHKAWLPLNTPSPVFETAFDWLRKNAGLNDKAPRTLVHGDYGLNNILIDNDRVSAVLDWEFAHIGNPAYDLGYFYFMGEALAPWEVFLDAYGKAGMPVPDEDQLNYNILFAATRLGVMVVQTNHVFTSGAEISLAPAFNLSGSFYEETIRRISFALDRVL